MLTALPVAHWRLLLTVLSVPGSWCLCSSDSPGCLPGLRSASCRKLTTAGTPRVLGRAGTGVTGNELSSLLLPCVPTYSSLGLSARILTTLKAPGDIPAPYACCCSPAAKARAPRSALRSLPMPLPPALLSPSPRPMGMWARPRASHRCHHAVHRPLTPTLQRPRWSVSGPCPFCSKQRPALGVTYWPLFTGLICVDEPCERSAPNV